MAGVEYSLGLFSWVGAEGAFFSVLCYYQAMGQFSVSSALGGKIGEFAKIVCACVCMIY